jgi:hypothetical protein
MTMRKPTLGPVCDASGDMSEILENLAYDLRYYTEDSEIELEQLCQDAENWEESDEDDSGEDLLARLETALQGIATTRAFFIWFGVQGDSYGFWPDMDSIMELPRVPPSLPIWKLKAIGNCVLIEGEQLTVFSGSGEILVDMVLNPG